MKLVNFLKPIECNQRVILKDYDTENILFQGMTHSLYNFELFKNYYVIKCKSIEGGIMLIYVTLKTATIEKQSSTVVSFHSDDAFPVTIEQFSRSMESLIDELENRGYEKEDYISIVAVGSAYKDGDDKNNATLIKLDMY